MYEILDDYHLLTLKKIEKNVSALDKSSLKGLFEEADRYYDRNLGAIISEFQSRESTNIIQYPNLVSEEFSKELCLYADKIAVNDPLYGILNLVDKGLDIEYIKSELKNNLRSYLATRKLVENNILFYVPVEKILVPAREKISEAIKLDCENLGFREICFENIEAELDEGNIDGIPYSFVFLRLGLKPPSKFSCALHFTTISGQKGEIGLEMKPGKPFRVRTPKTTRILRPRRLPKEAMEANEHVKTGVEHILFWQANEIISSIYLNGLLNATPIATSDVSWRLLNWKSGNIDTELKIAPALLEIDLKFLHNIDVDSILTIREEESTFEDFRLAFREFCQDVNSMPTTEDFRKEVQRLRKSKIDPQLRKLDRQFTSIRRHRLKRGVAIGIGTLVGAFIGPFGIPATLAGLVALLREDAEFDKDLDKLKENPLYFLWRLKSL